jgi:hypothetical protein
VTANCLHPATYMATTMVRQSGVTPISTVEEGAEAILNLARADELDGRSGQFYNGLRPSKANPQNDGEKPHGYCLHQHEAQRAPTSSWLDRTTMTGDRYA